MTSSPEMGEVDRRTLVDTCGVVGLESTDVFFIVILVLGVAAIVAAVFAFRQRDPAHLPGKTPNAWQRRAGNVCATGREVIDLTSSHDPLEAGIGLTIHELGVIETKLDQLVGQVRDIQPSAPTHEASHRMSLVAEHASSLNAVVRTQRRVRLSSLDLRGQHLDTIVLEFVSERSALDQVLSEISRELGPKR